MKNTELRRKRARLKRENEMLHISCDRDIHNPAVAIPSQKEVEAARARLRGSLLRYDDPLKPVLDYSQRSSRT